MARGRSRARLMAPSVAAAVVCLAAGAAAQDASFDTEERIQRLHAARLVLDYRDGDLSDMGRRIAWVEAEAWELVRALDDRAGGRPALTRLSQGEVLADAWFVVRTAELVGVPPHAEQPLRRALTNRAEPLRCDAIERFHDASRLGGEGLAGVLARDRLAEHGRDVARRCWSRARRSASAP